MNIRSNHRTSMHAFIVAVLPLAAHGQGSLGDGTFQNLDFGAATVVFIANSAIQIETGPALPGWNASIGGATPSSILYNDVFTGSPGLALFGPTPPTVGGSYSVDLEGGSPPQGGTVSLQQTGIVPAGANSIQFLSGTYPFYAKSIVSFGLNVNGQPISLVPLSVGNNVWSYSGSISQFAGQSATLDFYSLSGVTGGNFYLGDITFSSQVIPEPTMPPLLFLGAIGIGRSRRRRQARSVPVTGGKPE